MGFWLLQIEKIPIFIWGGVLALIGGFLSVEGDPWSKDQFIGIALAILGIAAIAFDIWRRWVKN